MRLLDVTNAKAGKGLRSPRAGADEHYLTGVFYMAPAHSASPAGKTVCPWAGVCVHSCLNYAGNRAYADGKRTARAERTRRWWSEKGRLVEDLARDIQALERAAVKWARSPAMPIVKGNWPEFRQSRRLTGLPGGKLSMKALVSKHGQEEWERLRKFSRLPRGVRYIPVVRLNGTSDLPWESMGIMERFPHLQFYDYTKSPTRMLRFLDPAGGMPKNYHLTFSFGGKHDERVPEILAAGGNVTMVFKPGGLPVSFGGRIQYRKPSGQVGEMDLPETRLINGDLDDLRFLDEIEKGKSGIRGGAIVGLKFKTVTDAVQAAKIAVMNDPLKYFVFDPGDRPRLGSPHRSNPSAAPHFVPPVASFRFGCGGAYKASAYDPS